MGQPRDWSGLYSSPQQKQFLNKSGSVSNRLLFSRVVEQFPTEFSSVKLLFSWGSIRIKFGHKPKHLVFITTANPCRKGHMPRIQQENENYHQI